MPASRGREGAGKSRPGRRLKQSFPWKNIFWFTAHSFSSWYSTLRPKNAPVGHLFAPVDNVRKELSLVNPNHIKLSGRKFLVLEIMLWDIHPAISCSSESLLAETAGSTCTKNASKIVQASLWKRLVCINLRKFVSVNILICGFQTWPQCVAMPDSS